MMIISSALLDVDKLACPRHLIRFGSHEKPYQQLFSDLAVTYHVVNDAQSNQSMNEHEMLRVRTSKNILAFLQNSFSSRLFDASISNIKAF